MVRRNFLRRGLTKVPISKPGMSDWDFALRGKLHCDDLWRKVFGALVPAHSTSRGKQLFGQFIREVGAPRVCVRLVDTRSVHLYC